MFYILLQLNTTGAVSCVANNLETEESAILEFKKLVAEYSFKSNQDGFHLFIVCTTFICLQINSSL